MNEQVARACRRFEVADAAALARVLRTDDDARRRFRRSVAISHAAMFRDPQQFALLEDELLPRLLAGGGRISAWSAGCSDGSELYSLGRRCSNGSARSIAPAARQRSARREPRDRASRGVRRRFGCCAGTGALRAAGSGADGPPPGPVAARAVPQRRDLHDAGGPRRGSTGRWSPPWRAAACSCSAAASGSSTRPPTGCARSPRTPTNGWVDDQTHDPRLARAARDRRRRHQPADLGHRPPAGDREPGLGVTGRDRRRQPHPAAAARRPDQHPRLPHQRQRGAAAGLPGERAAAPGRDARPRRPRRRRSRRRRAAPRRSAPRRSPTSTTTPRTSSRARARAGCARGGRSRAPPTAPRGRPPSRTGSRRSTRPSRSAPCGSHGPPTRPPTARCGSRSSASWCASLALAGVTFLRGAADRPAGRAPRGGRRAGAARRARRDRADQRPRRDRAGWARPSTPWRARSSSRATSWRARTPSWRCRRSSSRSARRS